MIEKIKEKAKELLTTKQVEVIIGFKRATDGVSAIPAFCVNEEDVASLIWDSYCVYNLATYLKGFKDQKVGVIAKACDIKAIIVLLQENQLKREDVFIIGVECSGVIDEKRMDSTEKVVEKIGFDKRCQKCKPAIPSFCDVLISQNDEKKQESLSEELSCEDIDKLEAKSTDEKFKFWQEEFSRCIRCYACRQICPLCYCPTCVADNTTPAWFSKATSPEGNFTWNTIRAMHLAGRCIDCGECERACPVGIPLRDINKKIERDVKEMFDYKAGIDIDGKPLFSSFDNDDPEDFIK